MPSSRAGGVVSVVAGSRLRQDGLRRRGAVGARSPARLLRPGRRGPRSGSFLGPPDHVLRPYAPRSRPRGPRAAGRVPRSWVARVSPSWPPCSRTCPACRARRRSSRWRTSMRWKTPRPVMAIIEFMLDGLPSGWTLLLSSRHRMPLALDRHVTRGRGVEIGLRRLRLTPLEVRDWARQLWDMDLGLPEARSHLEADRRVARRPRPSWAAVPARGQDRCPPGRRSAAAPRQESEPLPRERRVQYVDR